MRLPSTLTLIAWAMWFGGIMALFVFVQVLFKADRGVAMSAAPMLFGAFEVYQIFLAAATLIGVMTWYLVERRSRLVAAFGLLAVATIIAVVNSTVITRPMEQLRTSGQVQSASFKRLHGYSRLFYVTESAVLLLGGVVLTRTVRQWKPEDGADARHDGRSRGAAAGGPGKGAQAAGDPAYANQSSLTSGAPAVSNSV